MRASRSTPARTTAGVGRIAASRCSATAAMPLACDDVGQELLPDRCAGGLDVEHVELREDVRHRVVRDPGVGEDLRGIVGHFAVPGDDHGRTFRPAGQRLGVTDDRRLVAPVGAAAQQDDVWPAVGQPVDVSSRQSARCEPDQFGAGTERGDPARLGAQPRHQPGDDHRQTTRCAGARGAVAGVGKPRAVWPSRAFDVGDRGAESDLHVGGDRRRRLPAQAVRRVIEVDDRQLGERRADVEQPGPACAQSTPLPTMWLRSATMSS